MNADEKSVEREPGPPTLSSSTTRCESRRKACHHVLRCCKERRGGQLTYAALRARLAGWRQCAGPGR